jgi:hypothetical protein
MHFGVFIRYINAPTRFGPTGPHTEQIHNSYSNYKDQASQHWLYIHNILTLRDDLDHMFYSDCILFYY